MAKILLTIEANNTASASVATLNKQVAALSKTLSSITVNKDLTAQIRALTANYKEMGRVVRDSLKIEAQQISNQTQQQRAMERTSNSIMSYQKKFANLLSTIKGLKNSYPQGTFDEIERKVRENLQATKDDTKSVEDLGKAYETLSTKVAVAKAETDKVTTAVVKSGDSIGSLAKKFFLWQVTATLVMQPLRLIQNALSSINETLVKTEDSVIALQRVLPTGSATDNEISSEVYDIAQRYGQTFENVSEIATNFARTGMSWADTIKATEAAVLALNVAELDATEASEGLISILTQFEMKASDLETVVDKLNKAADRNPVTTEKLLTALQRTGAAAKNANITLDETIGIITTLSKATNRSGENLGTAVNSLIQFSSKESSLDTFAKFGGDVETAVEKFRAGAGSILEIWEELGEVIQNRQGEAESILGGGLFNNEEWASLNDELKEALGESYADVTDIYNTASVFRRNYFVALLNDMDNVKKVTGEIADANGYSQAENEKALQTYTKRLNSLKAQWEDIANSEQGLLGLKKFFVEIGSAILQVTKWTGGLTTAFLAAGTAITAIFGAKIVEKITSFGKKISSGALAIRKNFGELVSAQINASLANDQLTLAQERLNIARQKGIGIIEAEAAVTKAETAVTEANTAAKKAQAAAIGSVLTYAMLAITVISAVVGAVRQAQEEAKRAEEERRNAAQSSISDVNDTVSALNEYINKLDELKSAQEQGKDITAELSAVQDELKKKYEGVAEAIGKSNDKLKNNIDLTSEAARQAAIEDALRWRLKNDEAIKTATENVEEITQDRSSRATDNNYHLASVLTKAGFGDYVDAFTAHGQMGSAHEAFRFSFAGTKEEIIKQIEEINTYLNENGVGIGISQEDLELLKEMLSAAYNRVNTEAYKADKEIYDYNKKIDRLINGGTLAEFLGIEQKVTEGTAKQTNNIQDQISKYDDLIDKLKELRDAEKENLDLEEKKKAVLEAQKALRDAQKEATVRRYNDKTGQWEWQTDEKKIAEAEKDLEKARQDLEDQAYDTIIDQLEKKTATNEGIAKIINDVIPVLGEQFGETIREALKQVTGVDIYLPTYTPPADESYDRGGIANGLGFMPKATNRAEAVNDPELTAKILQPVSNEQFHRYVRDMGLLFETARQYVQAPVFERVGGAIDNRVDNRGQIIMNGVTIGSDGRSSSLDENLAIAGIVPNV